MKPYPIYCPQTLAKSNQMIIESNFNGTKSHGFQSVWSGCYSWNCLKSIIKWNHTSSIKQWNTLGDIICTFVWSSWRKITGMYSISVLADRIESNRIEITQNQTELIHIWIENASHAIWKQSVNKSSIIDCILNEYCALLMPIPKMGCLKCFNRIMGRQSFYQLITFNKLISRTANETGSWLFFNMVCNVQLFFCLYFYFISFCFMKLVSISMGINVFSEKCKCLWHMYVFPFHWSIELIGLF